MERAKTTETRTLTISSGFLIMEILMKQHEKQKYSEIIRILKYLAEMDSRTQASSPRASGHVNIPLGGLRTKLAGKREKLVDMLLWRGASCYYNCHRDTTAPAKPQQLQTKQTPQKQTKQHVDKQNQRVKSQQNFGSNIKTKFNDNAQQLSYPFPVDQKKSRRPN